MSQVGWVYPTLEDLVTIAGEVIDGEPQVRDLGLLAMSVARPQTRAFGFEPYVTAAEKAAALLVSICKNHALVDGNKRLALAAAFEFLLENLGTLPDMTNDEAYDMTIAVARGEADVEQTVAALRKAGIP